MKHMESKKSQLENVNILVIEFQTHFEVKKKKPVKFIGEIGNNSIDSLAVKAGLDSPACLIDQS